MEVERILAGSSDGFVAFDRDFRYTYVNDAAARMSGKSREQMLGQHVWQLFPEAAGGHLQKEFERSLRDNVRVELEYFDPGRNRWYENRVYPTGYGICVQFTDITARKTAEEALRESDRRKDEFLATLAHELRNPLAPMRLATEVLRRTTNPAQTEFARDAIDRQVATMARLIDDLMDVSRIAHGKIDLHSRPVELEDVLQRAIETSRPLLEAASQELLLGLPRTSLWLNADRTRIAQVLSNLINNASKYSAPRGRIWVTAEEVDRHAVVRVRDEGAGIEPQMLACVWDLFVQGGNFLARGSGLGVGLALARRLVELHGGSVEARSDGLGHGAEFTIRLPVIDVDSDRLPNEGAPIADAGPFQHAARARVLVADDNEDAARSLATYLELVGCDVQTATDGSTALSAAARFRPHVALLDLGMPALNGFELARLIRQAPWGSGMTLVAITGWSQEHVRQRSRDAGFDHHLVKPVSPETIQGLLRDLRAKPDPR